MSVVERITSASVAGIIEHHFADLAAHFNIQAAALRGPRPILWQSPRATVLLVRVGIPLPVALEELAVELGMLELGYLGEEGPVAGGLEERRHRTRARAWAARYLIPDEVMQQAERERWDERMLAAECGVPRGLARVRWMQWSAREGLFF